MKENLCSKEERYSEHLPAKAHKQGAPTSSQPREIFSVSQTRDDPPRYQSWDQWYHKVLNTIVEARDVLATHNLSFNALIGAETLLVLDDCHRYNGNQKTALQVLSWVLTLPPRSVDALTYVQFMNHNLARDELTERERAAADFLDTLYLMARANFVSQALKADDLPELIKSKKMADDMGSFPEEVQKIMEDDTLGSQQRHSRILGLIRDFRCNFISPIDISDMPLKKFLSNFTEAIKESERQPKVLSSLSHTLIRLIQSIRKDIERREIDKTGAVSKKKVIVITAGDIGRSKTNHGRTWHDI